MGAKHKLLLSVILTLLLGGQWAALAQNGRQKTDPAFTAFWIKFKAAVARRDKAAVADMTKLPFMIEGIDHDRAGFLKQYASLFTPSNRRCFAREKPGKEGDGYEIFCGDQIFFFSKVEGVWKFAEIGVND